jgi:hypothetical protein
MNQSTEGVTLFAVFVSDILKHFAGKEALYPELFAMVEGVDLSDPFAPVSMQLYNDLCAWIEIELGPANLTRLGREIGETVYTGMVQFGQLPAGPHSPRMVIDALLEANRTMINDPLKRNWQLLEDAPRRIVLRREQTYNGVLQMGLLDGLIRKSGVAGVKVKMLARVADGAEFDDYEITWVQV